MDDHETRNITLSADLAAAIDAAVETGDYASASAVVDEALREWAERRDNFGYTIEELRALVQEGIDSGPSLDGPEVMRQLRAKYDLIAEEADARAVSACSTR